MKNYLYPIIILSIALSCTPTDNTKKKSEFDKSKLTEIARDTTPKVTGIGGIFFYADKPKETKDWYAKNLGLVTNDWGSSFEFRNANRPQEINYLTWSPHNTTSNYFEPSEKGYMINYRVQNIEALIKKLKANGVTVTDEIATYEYGKFVHIIDLEGTKIELWEPIDSVLTAMGGETTK